jgi:hypothetical protein
MATAAAKRGKPAAKPAKAAPKSSPTKEKRKRSKRGQAKAPGPQAALLVAARAENPAITSEEFAIKFNLPFDEVARHKAFVHEYVKDYNPYRAALRMGYPEITAPDTARLELGNAFTQLYLLEIQKAANLESVVNQGQIAAKFWEEANRPDSVVSGCAMSNSSTRIAALSKLAQMFGMLTPKPKEDQPQVRRIMFVAEPIVNWEAQAIASQRALKTSTVLDV